MEDFSLKKKTAWWNSNFFVQRAKPWGPASEYPSNSHNTFWVWDPRLNLQSPAFMRHPSIHPFPKKKWKRKSKKKSLDRIPGHHRYQQWYQHWIGSKAQTCHESTAHGVELDNFWNPATKGWVKPRRNNKTVKSLVLYVCVFTVCDVCVQAYKIYYITVINCIHVVKWCIIREFSWFPWYLVGIM